MGIFFPSLLIPVVLRWIGSVNLKIVSVQKAMNDFQNFLKRQRLIDDIFFDHVNSRETFPFSHEKTGTKHNSHIWSRV
jgi:hypothetical protein